MSTCRAITRRENFSKVDGLAGALMCNQIVSEFLSPEQQTQAGQDFGSSPDVVRVTHSKNLAEALAGLLCYRESLFWF